MAHWPHSITFAWLIHQWLTPVGIAYLAALLALLALFNLMRERLVLFAVISLPSTIMHELMHWLLGALLFARPVGFSILPKRRARTLTMGAVSFANVRWYNGLAVGGAPLLLLPAAAVLVAWRIAACQQTLAAKELFWLYLLACMGDACMPSRQDGRIMLQSWPLLAALAGAVALYVLRHQMARII